MEKNKIGALRHKAYRKIKEKIINLELKPGEKIFEVELATLLKTSRTPIREALLMLENEKLVVCDNSMGFIVRRLSRKDVDEYFAVREVIEGFVLSLVVKNIKDKEIQKLRANIEKAGRVIDKGDDIQKIIKCETEFHEIMYRAAKSDVLFETISSLVDKFQWIRGFALSVPGSTFNSLAQHKKILEFVEKRDLKVLKKIMKEHLAEAKSKVRYFQGTLL